MDLEGTSLVSHGLGLGVGPNLGVTAEVEWSRTIHSVKTLPNVQEFPRELRMKP